MTGQIITLTTDFGLADHYVGSVKGVILSINPRATIVDISHEVLPQQIEHGAFLLAGACQNFPAGSIHLAVVDPGVGTQRRPLAIVTPAATFVGPDNGVLSPAIPDTYREAAGDSARSIALPPDSHAFVLTDERYHRRPVSATFHARDIFGPVAAHLSLGLTPEELGPEVAEIVALPPFRGTPQPDGSIAGRVLHIDRYGNIITSIRAEQLGPDRLTVEMHGRSISGLARTFADCDGLSALIGSSGYLGIALYKGSAARELGNAVNDPVTVLVS